MAAQGVQGVHGRGGLAAVDPHAVVPVALELLPVSFVGVLVPVVRRIGFAAVCVGRTQALMGDPVGGEEPGRDDHGRRHVRQERLSRRFPNKHKREQAEERKRRQLVGRGESPEQPGQNEIAKLATAVEPDSYRRVQCDHGAGGRRQMVVDYHRKGGQEGAETGRRDHEKPTPVAGAEAFHQPGQHQEANHQRNHVDHDQQSPAHGVRMGPQGVTRGVVNKPIRDGSQSGKQGRFAGVEMAVVLDHVDRVPVRFLDHFVDRVGCPFDSHVFLDQGTQGAPAAAIVGTQKRPPQ